MRTVYARYSYVFETVGQFESTHPQAVADMLAHVAGSTVGPDGIARLDGNVLWAPRQGSAQLTEAFPDHLRGTPSAVSGLAEGEVPGPVSQRAVRYLHKALDWCASPCTAINFVAFLSLTWTGSVYSPSRNMARPHELLGRNPGSLGRGRLHRHVARAPAAAARSPGGAPVSPL